MAAVTWPEVRTKIKAIADGALSSFQTKVVARELLGMSEDNSDPTLFRAAADNNRVNALLFWRKAVDPNSTISATRTNPGAVAVPLQRQRNAGKMLVQDWRIEFRLLYAYSTGTDASNSQNTFDAIVDALSLAFAQRPSLEIENSLFERTSDLHWSNCTVQQIGDLAVHQGIGAFHVVVRVPLSVNP